MDNEITKKFIENTGFICTKCGSVIVDGHKHYNEEDLCDKCRIADLEAKLAESEEKVKAMETLREMVNEDSKLNYRRYLDTLANSFTLSFSFFILLLNPNIIN